MVAKVCQHLMMSVSDQVTAYRSDFYLLFSLSVLVPPDVVIIVCRGLTALYVMKNVSFLFTHTYKLVYRQLILTEHSFTETV